MRILRTTTRAFALLLLAFFGACRSDGGNATGTVGPGAGGPRANVFNPLLQRSVTTTVQAQFAYNQTDKIVYGHLSWLSNRGQLDSFWRFESGQWVLRGRNRRELLNADQIASAETGVVLAWNNEANNKAMPNFEFLGCAVACHNGGSHMPAWAGAGRNDPETMATPNDSFYANGVLDFWHWRAHRSSPIGYWSDELLTGSPQPDMGQARDLDQGDGGFAPNPIVDGNPSFVFDPTSTTSGVHAVPFAQLETTPDYFFSDPNAPSAVSGVQAPTTLPYDQAEQAGFVPREGDTVPFWVLSRPDGSRGDILDRISPDGGTTVSQASFYDAQEGRWHVYFSRVMNTGDKNGDHSFRRALQYDFTVALHSDHNRGRDHYVSFPVRLWFEDPNNPNSGIGSDATARQLLGAGSVPDFDDTGFHEPIDVDMFLPGVFSMEYLTDTETAPYQFGQRHGGADDLLAALTGPSFIGCSDCHVVTVDDPFAPFVVGGALELRTPRRGGLFEGTPVSLEFNVLPVLQARCVSCHGAGGEAARVPFDGDRDTVHRVLTAPGRVRWDRPAESPLLTLPGQNLDGRHPPVGGLADFEGSEDQRRLLYWLLYNGQSN